MDKGIPDPTLPRYGYIQPRPFGIDIEPRSPLPKLFHMDQFFGSIKQCGLSGSTPDVTDVEFASGYVVCTRHGLQVAILEAEVVFNASTPAPGEAYRLRISDSYDPDYPVIDGITETYVDYADTFKVETGVSGDKLFVSLALNWARDLVP